ncbi:hypothetical protein VTG60DRAFT_3319 [Thermothelomyces hinnuleus]
MFKSGAVRLERLPPSAAATPEVPYIREQHSSALERVGTKSAAGTTARDDDDLTNRERHLGSWLGETYETVVQLLSIYDTLIPSLVHDLEVEAGVRVLQRLAGQARTALEPHAWRYCTDDSAEEDNEERRRRRRRRRRQSSPGYRRAHVLRRALFPPEDAPRSAGEVLASLQGLAVYVAHVRVSVSALLPAA